MTELNQLTQAENDPMTNTASNNAIVATQSAEAEESDQECAQFQALMADRIGAGEDLQAFPHMLTCDRCRALVGDLEAIAAAARQLMPVDLEPRDDLWIKIQDAIDSKEIEGDEGLAGVGA
jgi:hypothetical protein